MQDAKLGQCADWGHSALLISKSLVFRWVCKRILHALRHLLLSCLAPLLRYVIIVHVRVQACIDGRPRVALDSFHFGHNALLEDLVEHFWVLNLDARLFVWAQDSSLGRGCHRLAHVALAQRLAEGLLLLALDPLLNLQLLVESALQTAFT